MRIRIGLDQNKAGDLHMESQSKMEFRWILAVVPLMEVIECVKRFKILRLN